jgi:predicted Rossmann-fold nucleotide-binding protein
LNTERYWAGLLAVLDHAVDEQFVRPENAQLVLLASTPEGMLERLQEWSPPGHIEKWLDKTKR